ncbi:MAG: guanylate kinase [Clostridiales bacterium]|nr:guanylate kinase [Clostridiales bacterium]
MNKKGMMVILSAPSGCGKDTVFKEICKIRNDVCESVSATTRKPRPGEIDGVNYFFKSTEEFEKMIETNSFLEYASYNGCYYGTPSAPVLAAVENGKICFLIIERKGAQKIMKNYPDAVSVFLMPPDIKTLEHRLRKRNTESEEAIKNRLRIAQFEIEDSSRFTYVLVNNELEKAVAGLNEILDAELALRNKK